MAGLHDWRFVRISGLVRDVLKSETSSEWACLFLGADNEILWVSVPLLQIPLSDLRKLIGCHVALDGYAHLNTGSFRLFPGRGFHCAGPDAIHPLNTDLRNPFEADELRNCLWDLRNRALEESDMSTAIRQTLAPHANGVEIIIRFNVPRERFSDNMTHAILRIVRELTVNAIRHGKATKIRIAGSIEDNAMKFSVRDNGTGFDVERAPGYSEGHYGLLGIRERIEDFEGDFTLESEIGQGTKATITLNLTNLKR